MRSEGIAKQKIEVIFERPGHPSTCLADVFLFCIRLRNVNPIEASREVLLFPDLEFHLEEVQDEGSNSRKILKHGSHKGEVDLLPNIGQDICNSRDVMISGSIDLSDLVPDSCCKPRVFRLTVFYRHSVQELKTTTIEFALPAREDRNLAYGGISGVECGMFSGQFLPLRGWACRKGDSLCGVTLFFKAENGRLLEVGEAAVNLFSPKVRMGLPDIEQSDYAGFALTVDRRKFLPVGKYGNGILKPLRFRAVCKFASGSELTLCYPDLRWLSSPCSPEGDIPHILSGELDGVSLTMDGRLKVTGWVFCNGVRPPELWLEGFRDRLKVEDDSTVGTELSWTLREDVLFSYLPIANRRHYGFEAVINPLILGRHPGRIRLIAKSQDSGKQINLLSHAFTAHLNRLITGLKAEQSVIRRVLDKAVYGASKYFSVSDLSTVRNQKTVEARSEEHFKTSDRVRKILFATHNCSQVEGAPKMMYEVVRALASYAEDAALEPWVVGADSGDLVESYNDKGVKNEIIYDLSLAHDGWYKFADGYMSLVERIEQEKPSMVYANSINSFWAVQAAAQFSLPVVWVIHESVNPHQAFVDVDLRFQAQFLFMLSWCRNFVFTAESTKTLYEPFLYGKNVRVIPNGVEVEDLHKGARGRARKDFGIWDDENVVLIVGTTTERKGQDEYIRAMGKLFKSHPEARFRFLVVGARSGWYLDYLRRLAADQGEEFPITFVPEKPDIRAYYNAADILVIASKEESAPLVVLEAMANAVPIVSTKVFGLSEQLAHGKNALFYDIGDDEGLAATVWSLIANPQLKKSIAEQALEEVKEHYALRGTVEAHLETLLFLD